MSFWLPSQAFTVEKIRTVTFQNLGPYIKLEEIN